MTKRQASDETCRALADAIADWAAQFHAFCVDAGSQDNYDLTSRALARYRAETAPRTRAEADADIAAIVRAHSSATGNCGVSLIDGDRERAIKRLCAEETA